MFPPKKKNGPKTVVFWETVVHAKKLSFTLKNGLSRSNHAQSRSNHAPKSLKFLPSRDLIYVSDWGWMEQFG